MPISLSIGARINWSVSALANNGFLFLTHWLSCPDFLLICQLWFFQLTINSLSFSVNFSNFLFLLNANCGIKLLINLNCSQATICFAGDHAVALFWMTLSDRCKFSPLILLPMSSVIFSWIVSLGLILSLSLPFCWFLPSSSSSQYSISLSVVRNKYSLVTSIIKGFWLTSLNWNGCCTFLASIKLGWGLRSGKTKPSKQNCLSW